MIHKSHRHKQKHDYFLMASIPEHKHIRIWSLSFKIFRDFNP